MEYLIAIILVIALSLGGYNLYKIGEYKGYISGYNNASNYAIKLMEKKRGDYEKENIQKRQ